MSDASKMIVNSDLGNGLKLKALNANSLIIESPRKLDKGLIGKLYNETFRKHYSDIRLDHTKWNAEKLDTYSIKTGYGKDILDIAVHDKNSNETIEFIIGQEKKDDPGLYKKAVEIVDNVVNFCNGIEVKTYNLKANVDFDPENE